MGKQRKQYTKKAAIDKVSPEDNAFINSASEKELREKISQAGIAKQSVKHAMEADEDLSTAKKTAKELAAPYREDLKEQEYIIAACYDALEGQGKDVTPKGRIDIESAKPIFPPGAE